MLGSVQGLEQPSLFGRAELRVDTRFSAARRIPLRAGAWVEYAPGWLEGHEWLFEHLRRTTRWRAKQRPMYERIVHVPRLLAAVPDHGPGHPILWTCARLLSARYGFDLSSISMAYYRDGNDSVAPHGDRLGRRANDAVVAIVAVGERRTLRLNPREGGPGLSFQVGWGDLFVMGGTCQRTYLHGIPKAKRAGPRISIQYRPAGYRDAARDEAPRFLW
ncbi:MAG: alpha-ketoglutarate-dependent dioxygenase AlkB [Deltaproteobacteria bacterium]|nr:MAG: alpha-ketoglutarate-dependent dioxygenase AlkB [Deltaproteobacteria bacterium]